MHSFLSRISKNDFFVAWFAQKTKIIKRSSFRQKLWTNPFQKVWFVGLFSKFNFLVQKAFFFTGEYQKTIFSELICQKNTHDQKFDFLTKNMDPPPFAKSGFFVLFENLIFLVYKAFYFYAEDKKRSFWLDLPKKTYIIKKVRFCDKNHGLTPLEKFDFLHFFKSYFFRSRKHCLICPRNTHKKVLFFDQNHGLTPLKDFHWLDFLKTSFFWSEKHSFLRRI